MRSLLIIIALCTFCASAFSNQYLRDDLLKLYEITQEELKQELVSSGVETIVENVLDSARAGLTEYVVLDKSPDTYTEIKQTIFDKVRTIFPDSDVFQNISDNTYSVSWGKPASTKTPATYNIPGMLAPIQKSNRLR